MRIALTLPTLLLIPLDRLLWRSGAFHRRDEARAAIADGRVLVDDVLYTKNAAVESSSTIWLDASPLPPPPPTVTYALHKPRGVLTACADGEGATVMGLLPDVPHGLSPVGRLDQDSEGLILLTNDGTCAKLLLEPGACPKTYVALVEPRAPRSNGDCDDDDSAWLRRMESGIVLANGYAAKAESCRVLDAASARTIGCEAFAGLLAEGQGGSDAGHRLVEVVMRQGAKREVRRLLKAAGYRTLRLCRVAVGNVAIDGLHSGEVREVSRDQLLGLYASAFRDHSSSVMDLPTFDAPTGGWVRASELAAIGSERRELVRRR